MRGALNFIGAGVEVRGGDVRLNADNTFVNTPPQLQLLMASLLGKYSRKWQSLSELHDAVSVASSNWAPGSGQLTNTIVTVFMAHCCK